MFSACLDGFIGEECKISCPYPAYGRNCDLNCDCEEKYCNVSMGCLQGKVYVIQITCVRNYLIFFMIDTMHWEKQDDN